jgi:hypothetical protein
LNYYYYYYYYYYGSAALCGTLAAFELHDVSHRTTQKQDSNTHIRASGGIHNHYANFSGGEEISFLSASCYGGRQIVLASSEFIVPFIGIL